MILEMSQSSATSEPYSEVSEDKENESLVVEFSDKDYAGVSHPHIDALVVTLQVANH
jgi:hypothetical protein